MLILIYAVAAGMRSLLDKGGLRFRRVGLGFKARHLKIIESLMLGPGKAIYLISVGKKAFLVGVAGSAITLLGRVGLEEEYGEKEDENAMENLGHC